MHTINIWKRGNECNMGNFLSKWRHWLTSETRADGAYSTYTVCEQKYIVWVKKRNIDMKKKLCVGWMSLSMILKFFFNFGRFEPCDSYKLYSYKKESV